MLFWQSCTNFPLSISTCIEITLIAAVEGAFGVMQMILIAGGWYGVAGGHGMGTWCKMKNRCFFSFVKMKNHFELLLGF